MDKQRQSFLKSTIILLAAGVSTRILGFVPRIVLPRIMGAEGIGLYQMAYPFLILILALITGGIPIAIAKLVAEAQANGDEGRSRSILKHALAFVISLSILFTANIIMASSWITTFLLTDSRVYYTFLSMGPIVPIVAMSSVFCGYFQGRHNMIPTASSQVAETMIRIVASLLLSYFMLPYGMEYAAAGVMIGMLIGELGGFLVLFIHYKERGENRALTQDQIRPGYSNIRQLLKISVPVTGSKLVGSGSYFLESIMIVKSLAVAGVATTVATAQYGILQGMVIPLLLMPTALTYSLSVSLIPSLSEAAARKDLQMIHKRLHQSLRLVLITSAPFVVMMYVLADPISYYVFNNMDVGKLLKMMAPAALFLYVQAPLQAALHALDKPGTALLNTFIGASIKLILIYQLVTKPQLGIIGAVIAMMVNMVLVTVLYWNSVSRLLHFSMKWSEVTKVILGMVIMGITSFLVMDYPWASSFVRFLAAGLSGALIYLCFVVWVKLVDKQDLLKVPWLGNKVTKWL